MADLSYQVQIDTNQAQQSLTKLQGSLGRFDQAMGRLKGVLAGAAFAGFSRAAIAMADDIQDLSNATGIATTNILNFKKAVELGGGSAESATKGILNFYQSIDEAAQGGIKAQAAFDTLGIKLSDLANLSESALFDKTVEALAKMGPSAQKTSIQAELLGKAFRGVTIDQDFVDKLRAGEGEAAKTAATIKRAAELNDQWNESVSKLKLSFLEAFGPAISSISTMLEMVPKLTTAFKILGVVVATALAVTGARALVSVLGMVARGFTAISSVGGRVWQLFGNIGNGANTVLSPLGKLRDAFSFLVAPIAAATSALALFWDTLFGSSKAEEENTDVTNANADAQRQAKSAIEAKVLALKQQVAEFEKANAATIDQINVENQLLGKSKEYSDVIKAQEALYKRSVDEIDRLRNAKAQLSDEEKQLGLGAEYDKQIQKIIDLTKVEAERVKKAVENANKLQQAEEFRLYGIKAQQDAQDSLTKLQRESVDITLTDIEKKYLDIARAADDSAKAAIRAEEARRGEKLSTAEVEKYYDTARKGSESLVNAQKKLYDSSRTFSSGWTKAFKEYKDSATNAAATATRVFDKFTSGLEDMFVEFAKTGKFEWKGFVNSLLEELLRSQLKETIAGVLNLKNPLSSGGGSIGDMFGGIFGALGSNQQRGQSATAPLYVVDVSGGGALGGLTNNTSTGGPGLFDTIGNVFSTVKNSVGNAFSGIGDLFSGFFATGGTIPAGKFGVVGERGPELIGGPANITPMGTGSVTFNINAVDAPSFQALLARDPGFLYAVAMKGAGAIPAGR